MTATATMGDERVLVLNRNWLAVDVTDVLKAAHKVFNSRALFVDPLSHATYEWEDWVLNWDDAMVSAKREEGRVMSVCGIFEMVVPEVIVCTEYTGQGYKLSRRRPKFSRLNVYRRDRNTCQYCGKRCRVKELTLDHVMPKSKGGEMTWENIALACFPCNSRKDNRTPEEAGMRLCRQPFRPRAEDLALNPRERLMRRVGERPSETWQQFLGKMYWEVELKA